MSKVYDFLTHRSQCVTKVKVKKGKESGQRNRQQDTRTSKLCFPYLSSPVEFSVGTCRAKSSTRALCQALSKGKGRKFSTEAQSTFFFVEQKQEECVKERVRERDRKGQSNDYSVSKKITFKICKRETSSICREKTLTLSRAKILFLCRD